MKDIIAEFVDMVLTAKDGKGYLFSRKPSKKMVNELTEQLLQELGIEKIVADNKNLSEQCEILVKSSIKDIRDARDFGNRMANNFNSIAMNRILNRSTTEKINDYRINLVKQAETLKGLNIYNDDIIVSPDCLSYAINRGICNIKIIPTPRPSKPTKQGGK